MARNIKAYREPTRDEIAACAHQIYELEGRPEGKAMEHWLQAEAQLIAECKAEAGLFPLKPAKKPFDATGEERSSNAPILRPAPSTTGTGWQKSARQNLN